MSSTIVRSHSVTSALVAALQFFAPPLVTMLSLRLAVAVARVEFDQDFVVLTAVAGALAIALLQPRREATAQLPVDRLTLSVGVLARWGALLLILFTIGYITRTSAQFSREAILLWALFNSVLLVVSECGLHGLWRYVLKSSARPRRAVFAGCNEVSIALAQRLHDDENAHINPVGFFDDRGADRLPVSENYGLLGKLPDLPDFAKQQGIDLIFIALPMRHLQRVIELLDRLRDTTASIYYVPDIFVYELIQARTTEVVGMPIVAMCETPFYGYRGVTKRLMDIVIAGVALVLLLPVLVVIAVIVKLTSRGPAIFRQTRYGLDGERIVVYKFRSMRVAEDGDQVVQARREDSRVTPVGTFLRRMSLDELPQLMNVLQGRMSLVGPRPHAVAHNEQYRHLIKGYMIRHKVKPGITGLAQVNGCRGETARLEEMQVRVQYDLEYLRRWTPALDLQILWRTLVMIFRREAKAY
jgi:putative colanic acid biosynthesis UDP-glucose lipid carrier transferase